MSFQELMEIGGTEERKKLEELKNELQCDDPINIQFTSVSCAQRERKLKGKVSLFFLSFLINHDVISVG